MNRTFQISSPNTCLCAAGTGRVEWMVAGHHWCFSTTAVDSCPSLALEEDVGGVALLCGPQRAEGTGSDRQGIREHWYQVSSVSVDL